MIAGAAGIWVMGRWFAERILSIMRHGLNLDRRAAFDVAAMGSSLMDLGTAAVATLAPLFIILILAVFAGPFAIGGWLFAPKALRFDPNRLDPLQGLGRIFSINGLAELTKAIAKTLVVGAVAVWVIRREQEPMFALMAQPLTVGIAAVGELVLFSTLLIVAGMALIAAADVPFQLWQYHRQLRMTKEEARQEAKELEGDPQIKARVRQQQREIARRRMMQEVPKADVIVTNPTHFSVALKYESERMRAPKVVAKGRGELALRIREIGAANEVPTVEAPALARALYRHTEIGDEVPTALYTAVAEVMAYIYQLNQTISQGGLPPQPPAAIDVPADLDPGAAE